jgi:hypothetical protein
MGTYKYRTGLLIQDDATSSSIVVAQKSFEEKKVKEQAKIDKKRLKAQVKKEKK